MPMSDLATLEQPLALITGNDLIEKTLLHAPVVQVMVDDLIAERPPRNAALLHLIYRLPQRRREARRVRLVGVALERLRQLELPLDPVQACGDHRRESEIGIHVTAWDARLDALRSVVAHDPKAARSVVDPPRERRRRPAPGRVALVRVDIRCEEERQLVGAGDLPCEESVEDLVVPAEHVHAIAPEARVDVAGAHDPG